METVKAIYTTLVKVNNVKISVPAIGAMWLVGVLNIVTGQITALGKGKEGANIGLSYKTTSPEQIVIYTVGMVVKDQGRTVIVNRTYSGLAAADFGKNSNFTVEVKNKQIGEKNFTSLTLTKAPGAWSYELKFSDNENPDQPSKDGQKDYQITGTNAKILIIPTHQPQLTPQLTVLSRNP